MIDRPAAVGTRLKAPLAIAGAMLAGWLLLQALVWRSGAYWYIAEPDSNIGAVTQALFLLDAAYRPGRRTVLVFGDSRVGEGFSAPLASAGGDVDFINLAVPGSTARTWYYLLREVERRGYRYDALLIGTLYVPTDLRRSAEWPLDPRHQVQLLGLRDLADYPDWRPILLPELMAQDDLRGLLLHPLRRLKAIRARAIYAQDAIRYPGREDRVPDDFEVQASPPIPEALARENAAWQYRWLRRIGERAAARGAPTLAYALPRGPRREVLPPRRMPDWPGIETMPADLFADLEAPPYFFDALHLNRAGRERVSAVMGERVRARLAREAH